MRIGGIGGALLIFIVSCSWGYTFLDLGPGSAVFQGSARCGGMGEITLLCEKGPMAVALNPANLALLERPEATFSYGFHSLEEDWSFPAYDSFDALLGYNTYSANSNLYHDGSLAFASGCLPQTKGVCLGVAFVPVYDFRYDFHEEIRDRSSGSVPSDKVIADDFIEGDGDIRSFSLGAAWSMDDRLALGLSMDYLFGDYDLTARIFWVDETKIPFEGGSRETSDTFSASKLSGMRLRFGGTYEVTERVMVAGTFTSGCELDGDFQWNSEDGLLGFLPGAAGRGGEHKVEYPAAYSLGFTFRPRNELLTVVEGNMKFTQWSDFRSGVFENLVLDDTFEWHIGVEHVFYSGRPLRFGFLYRPSPIDDETSEAAVTAGSAIMVSGFEIGFSGKVGWREYRHPDLFDDAIFGAKTREVTDKVEETSVSGIISISRRF